MGRKIGIFGGTFDPLHNGHIAAAEAAHQQIGLDLVLFVVANIPWQKSSLRVIESPEDRLAMVEAAVTSIPEFEASRLEIDRQGESYMSDTVQELQSQFPSDQFFLILGEDVAAGLTTWHNIGEVIAAVEIVIVRRRHDAVMNLPTNTRVSYVELDVPVSSTMVRDRIMKGQSIENLVPAEVLLCIKERELYSGSR